MSKGRRLFREYAKSRELDVKEFIEITQGFYEQDTLVYKDSEGMTKRMSIDYQ